MYTNLSLIIYERMIFMTTVEPIRKMSDLRKIEKILAAQSMRDLVLFTIGTNCTYLSGVSSSTGVIILGNRHLVWV